MNKTLPQHLPLNLARRDVDTYIARQKRNLELAHKDPSQIILLEGYSQCTQGIDFKKDAPFFPFLITTKQRIISRTEENFEGILISQSTLNSVQRNKISGRLTPYLVDFRRGRDIDYVEEPELDSFAALMSKILGEGRPLPREIMAGSINTIGDSSNVYFGSKIRFYEDGKVCLDGKFAMWFN